MGLQRILPLNETGVCPLMVRADNNRFVPLVSKGMMAVPIMLLSHERKSGCYYCNAQQSTSDNKSAFLCQLLTDHDVPRDKIHRLPTRVLLKLEKKKNK